MVERVDFDKNLNNFFGAKDNYGTTQSQKKRQTRDEALKIFFGIVEKEPRIISL